MIENVYIVFVDNEPCVVCEDKKDAQKWVRDFGKINDKSRCKIKTSTFYYSKTKQD